MRQTSIYSFEEEKTKRRGVPSPRPLPVFFFLSVCKGNPLYLSSKKKNGTFFFSKPETRHLFFFLFDVSSSGGAAFSFYCFILRYHQGLFFSPFPPSYSVGYLFSSVLPSFFAWPRNDFLFNPSYVYLFCSFLPFRCLFVFFLHSSFLLIFVPTYTLLFFFFHSLATKLSIAHLFIYFFSRALQHSFPYIPPIRERCNA